MGKTIIITPKGEDRKEVDIDKVHIPDLWHYAMMLKFQLGLDYACDQLLECWHLAHDLKNHIQAN